jgi:hypothetical protein
VGVYFFSQAVNAKRREEEAQFILELIKDYDRHLPVAFDWERIEGETESRTYDLPAKLLPTARLRSAILSWKLAMTGGLFLPRSRVQRIRPEQVKGLKFWVGAVGGYPDFYYEHQIWQFHSQGRRRHRGRRDLNMCFTELPDEEGMDAEETDSQA